MKEYSLFGIKPDAYMDSSKREGGDVLKKEIKDINDFIKYVKKSLEKENLYIVEEKEYKLSKAIAEKHYDEHRGVWCNTFNEDKFEFLLKYMTEGKSYWIVFSGEDAIKKGREVLVNIREEYLKDRKKARLNMTHASDSIQSGKREILIHFPEFEFNYK